MYVSVMLVGFVNSPQGCYMQEEITSSFNDEYMAKLFIGIGWFQLQLSPASSVISNLCGCRASSK
jgi:hypothetical protein